MSDYRRLVYEGGPTCTALGRRAQSRCSVHSHGVLGRETRFESLLLPLGIVSLERGREVGRGGGKKGGGWEGGEEGESEGGRG